MSNTYKDYNPDILETIANLSNDEVFTPPKLANDILDLLPEEVWSDSTITFLDPAVKTGIFLREITSRLIDGLADEIPDLQERVNHILTKQVFGLGITELTALMSRRTVYCSTTANGEYSICTEFDNVEGNIKFPDTKHNFDDNGRCEQCGANQAGYEYEDGKDNHAYSFIHDDLEEVFGNMKFDVIVGNPPYQLSDGGAGSSAIPLYNKFVQKSIEMSPKYISMIIPSRWMNGGKGLNTFRKEMLDSNKIIKMHDFIDSEDCFNEVRVDGGVCYFLWGSNHYGLVDYSFKDLKGSIISDRRSLRNKHTDGVIRDKRQLSIISKVFNNSEAKFSSIVSPRNPFGLNTDLFNVPENYKNIIISTSKNNLSQIKVYGFSSGKRIENYINISGVQKGLESVDKYKVFFSKAYSTNATIPPEAIEAYPKSAATDTFLKIGDFDKESEMLNCSKFMKTNFFRALLFFNRNSLSVSRSTFDLIPLQNFSKPWTDAELYKKYNLTEDEIQYIEDNIDPMGEQEEVDLVGEEYSDGLDDFGRLEDNLVNPASSEED